MSAIDDYTIDDARNYGFGLLGLYKLWHWNNCIPHGPWHDELDEKMRATQRELDDRYQLLPVDADGEVIHVGDELQWDDGERLTVIGVGNDIVFYVNDDGLGGAQWTKANNKHHYHKPTIEDVLREFAEKVTDSQIPGTHPTYEEAIAEYAKKLQLKEDE